MPKAIFAKHVKAIRFDEVRVGDIVGHFADRPVEVTRLSVVTQDEARITRMDFPGNIRLHFGDNAYISDSPDRLIGLLGRPCPEGKTEADMLHAVEAAMRGVTRVGTLPPGKTFDLTIHQCRIELDPFRDEGALRAVREAIEAYELGKPEEPAKSEPEPENCYEGRCKHPKNFAGSCLVYLMEHPPQRNC